jgi:hypothetical protein
MLSVGDLVTSSLLCGLLQLEVDIGTGTQPTDNQRAREKILYICSYQPMPDVNCESTVGDKTKGEHVKNE